MKSISTFRLIRRLCAVAIILCAGGNLLAQGGRGGGQVGTPGLALPATDPYLYLHSRLAAFKLTDLDLTAITKLDEQVEKQVDAVAAARAALEKATFALPSNRADIAAKVDALTNADLELAVARTQAWSKLQAEMKFPPEKVAAIQKAMSSPVLGGGPGGVVPGGGAQ